VECGFREKADAKTKGWIIGPNTMLGPMIQVRR
jgi:hypothetical protein